MSVGVPSSRREALLAKICRQVDPRLGLTPNRVLAAERLSPPTAGHIVLVGHRAAGKTRLLPLLAEWVNLPAIDLDAAIAKMTGRPVLELVQEDVRRFREEERRAFGAIDGRRVVAAGGGFLSNHADLLEGHTGVVIPISFETYRKRLMADTSRPRLRPEVPLEEEIREIFDTREALHARVPTMPLMTFLRSTLEEPSP